ncbi:trehalose/maltose hydrolase-like predicted phosphorylase [Methylobacterium fujisawaense]|uniref:Trehalose/maltose hydrolase-like predicted phosphorylase n=1 Tax=Methylobacterium fujisawaense TaxID=107400 RepID=A0ABR6DHE1_9HYPH|nr:glycoside hydrolase family 65 protein [Methylobacterium fujisawaense]MBA9064749.1 trehalose/maltose hydrolase-like predicted phosphorylase [Methylobacterium fujisawaense]
MSVADTLAEDMIAGGDPSWLLRETGYELLRESTFETRFALSNGFLGVRGGLASHLGACRAVPPRIYVAGLFDTPTPDSVVPELVPAPDWTQVRILLPDGPLMRCPDRSSRALTLDMRRGALFMEARQTCNAPLDVCLRSLRLVSLHARAIGMQVIELRIESGVSDLTFEAAFGPTDFELAPERAELDLKAWRTWRSGRSLAIAAAASLEVDGIERQPVMRGDLTWNWSWTAQPGQIVTFRRIIAVTRHHATDVHAGARARKELAAARTLGWRGILARHEAAWAERWRCSDIRVTGDDAAQAALRFAIYHLNGAANPEDPHVSVAARALTGDDYRGHVFWDTEIFLVPFYALTWPEAARTLLMYRFRTLDAARAKAAQMGCRGALYAWESADSGSEVTPAQTVGPDRKILDVLCGSQEQHISADVAYAVWQYWQATEDEAFLQEAGAEIILETARFWTWRAAPEADGRRHIRTVIGPDEYHEGVDDNAFTNGMARWTIARGLDVAALVQARWPETWARLARSLDLGEAELAHWREAAEAIATGFDPATGLFEQFAGFSALETVDLNAYAGRSVPMDVVLGRERTQRAQVIKQADVVALLALLPEAFPGASGGTNFDHYEPRCGHGSSLSRAMHGLAAARLGRAEAALSYFRRSAAIDLADTHVAIGGGIHVAALGGVWMIAILGFAGLSLRADGLAFDPCLPADWQSLDFRIRWRGRDLAVAIDGTTRVLRVALDRGAPMTVFAGGAAFVIAMDRPLTVKGVGG